MVFPKLCFLSMIPVYQISLESLRFQGNSYTNFGVCLTTGGFPKMGSKNIQVLNRLPMVKKTIPLIKGTNSLPTKKKSVRYNILCVYVKIYIPASSKGCCLNLKGCCIGTPYHPLSTPWKIQVYIHCIGYVLACALTVFYMYLTETQPTSGLWVSIIPVVIWAIVS